MDVMNVPPVSCNPELLRVLKDYKTAAEASLKGPSHYMEVWGQEQNLKQVSAEENLQEFRKAMMSASLGKKQSSTSESDRLIVADNLGSFYNHTSGGFPGGVPNLPIGPLLIPMDSSHSERSDTTLERTTISCFIVGGEKRLCLPQILNTVLQNFDLRQINDMCDDLHIFCSRCNPQQLERLKLTGVLPPSAPSCGLITKTDAERLCNALLHGSPEKSKEPSTPNSFKVYHECFGKCKGVLNPELYTEPDAKCIECCHCHGMFSPQKFVVHSDKALENRTCHWGFDSGNWRAYILLAKDQDSREMMQRALDDIKDKFDISAGFKKRRENSVKQEDLDSKRARYEDCKDFDPNSPWAAEFVRGVSAFRPWSPSLATLLKEGKLPGLAGRDGVNPLLPSYLQSGPPVLLNPERVVPFTDTKRYDRHFAPNVSLAPPAGKEDSKEGIIEFENMVKVNPKLLSSTSSFSSSALSSPSPIKTERTTELDLSSSDESSFRSESIPVTPQEEYRSLMANGLPTEVDVATDREKFLLLVRQALETISDTKSKEREQILEQVAEVCSRQEDRTRLLLQSCKLMDMECEKLRTSKRERLQEMSESRYMIRLEVERLQQELQAANKLRLAQESQAAKTVDVSRIKAKYKSQIEVLRGRVGEYERQNGNLAAEVTSLRHQLKLLSRNTHNNHQTAAPVNKRHNGDLTTEEDVDVTMESSIETRQNVTLKAVLNGKHPELVKVDIKDPPASTEEMDT